MGQAPRRRILVEDQKLDAVVSLPGGAFKPYAGVSTAILLFTKTNSGGTDHVWFYDVTASTSGRLFFACSAAPSAERGTAPSLSSESSGVRRRQEWRAHVL